MIAKANAKKRTAFVRRATAERTAIESTVAIASSLGQGGIRRRHPRLPDQAVERDLCVALQLPRNGLKVQRRGPVAEQARDHRYAAWVNVLRRAEYLRQREQGPTRV